MFLGLHWSKRLQVLCMLYLLAPGSYADTLTLTPASPVSARTILAPYFSAWEDAGLSTTPAMALFTADRFVPVNTLQRQDPTHIYWLQMTIRNNCPVDPNMVLLFTNLTFVDVYLYNHDRCVWHRQAGAFRAQQFIAAGDSRFHTSLPLAAGRIYTLLVKVQHTKHYQPVFDFALQGKETFTARLYRKELVDGWSQGAIVVFFFYTLLSWLVSRFRPYAWLLLYMAGAGLFGISSGGYWIDWLFADDPATGWLFNVHFLHLGLFGIYMLVTDFWQLPQHNPTLHRFGKMAVGVLLLISVASFCINFFTGNYNLTNSINLWGFLILFSLVVCVLWVCRKRLSRAQRYLYYGIILFGAAALLITLSSAIFHEKSLFITPYITHFTTLVVFILFATGLKEELQQHEIDKNTALNSLNQLQKLQNILLEKKVADRTHALQQSNEQLTAQTDLLAQRNTKIEKLINELSHRVKNNLQLLYSLISLQLPMVHDDTSRNVLHENMARIKAMMLVNQQLEHFEEDIPVSPEFVAELTIHLQQIYDSKKSVSIRLNITPGILLPAKQTLSIGLILSELLTNTFKYAFNGITHPSITIELTLAGAGNIRLVYADNGIGMKDAGAGTRASMGLPLVKDLTRQMNGTVNIRQENGLAYEFTIQV